MNENYKNCSPYVQMDCLSLAPTDDWEMNQTFSHGSKPVWQVGLMMKPIMKTGVVSVALAAATLLIPAAHAQERGERNRDRFEPRHEQTHRGYESNHRDNRDWRRGHGDRFELTRRERRQVINQCERAADDRADWSTRRGRAHTEFVGRPYVRQFGPAGYEVEGAVRVSTRRGSNIVPVECTIRRGRVVDLDMNPRRGRGHHNDNGRRYTSRY
ncbi:hypothetical protein [Ponticaulis sp.]|uniref:hypothetical protein n=1 Tax=Ponticaulis sp. TaxID=2020902 RepID=UPI002620929B|nr:hypothetical protein [Ponticaulis sp.]MDF1681656.1 hypothetical protein [Ponticaulis sp.]